MDLTKKQSFKKIIISLVLVFLASLIILFLLRRDAHETSINQVILGGQAFSVELALSPEQHYQGLSDRASLCADCGMLFLFNNRSQRSFVMRKMLFPLDIIFIDGETVVDIYKNLTPEGPVPQNSYSSSRPVDKVLELNGGRAAELGLKIGDNIILK